MGFHRTLPSRKIRATHANSLLYADFTSAFAKMGMSVTHSGDPEERSYSQFTEGPKKRQVLLEMRSANGRDRWTSGSRWINSWDYEWRLLESSESSFESYVTPKHLHECQRRRHAQLLFPVR